MSVTKKRSRPVISDKMCKKCNICVTFCPKQVFTARQGQSPLVSDPDACIGCELCVIQCPDFAIILVERGETQNG